MKSSDFLFVQVDWFSVDSHQRKTLSEEISAIDPDRLLNTSLEDLCDYFEKKYHFDVPVLLRDELVVDQREVDIQVPRNPYLPSFGNEGPVYTKGLEVEVSVPFTGDAEAFKVQHSSYVPTNPIRAEVHQGLLQFTLSGTDLKAQQVRKQIDNTLDQIERQLTNLRSNASSFNSQLREMSRQEIETRRNKLLANRNLVGSLGFKIKERSGPKTYIAPEVRRKLTPVMPPASSAPYKPEPALSTDDYELILSVIQNMAQVMERSPSAFTSMDEESLRSHFLVQLNGHYAGQATGETFNYSGKTDILIRSGGRNIFIAECKFWAGPKKLMKTLDQILDYSSWRDTKVAVILFNRNKDFTNVLKSVEESVKTHANCKRESGKQSETVFRYLFAHRDDPNREMILTVLLFDVPI